MRKVLIRQIGVLAWENSAETELFHQAAANRNNLGVTDIKTITILMLEGPMTAGSIANRLNLTTGAVTNIIDRLLAKNLLNRTFDAKDKRKVIVVVNLEKCRTIRNVYRPIGRSFEKMLETYSTKELEILSRYHKSELKLIKFELARLNGADFEKA